MSARHESTDSDEFASAESEAEEETSSVKKLELSDVQHAETDKSKGLVATPDSDAASMSLNSDNVGRTVGEHMKGLEDDNQVSAESLSPTSEENSSEPSNAEVSEVPGTANKPEAVEQSQQSSSPEKTAPASGNEKSTSNPADSVKPVTDGGGGGEGGGGGGWGSWGGWGTSLWSSVSSVAESAQAIGQKVTSVIATVEDSLGVPSPEELAVTKEEAMKQDEETRRLAETIVEHDERESEVVEEEPHQQNFDPKDSQYLQDESTPPTVPQDSEEGAVAAVSNFFSDFAAAVQSTGQGLVSGGLDALETLGKKTMEVLSEGDPGFARKRAMLGMGASPSLSQLLKEAKAEGSARAVEGGEDFASAGPLNYSRLFEEYHGVGHLEALELLSKECVTKSHAMATELSGPSFQRLQDQLEELTQAFIFDDDQANLEDDSCKLLELKDLLATTSLLIKSDKLLQVSSRWREKVDQILYKDKNGEATGDEKDKEDSKELEESNESGKPDEPADVGSDMKTTCTMVYENGLRSLAELTSASIELFRKMAEVSLVPQMASGDPLAMSNTFNKMTVMLINELDALASVHAEAITGLDVDGTNSSVTSLYLESSNSGSYVQDAFQLLQPVLKVLLVQHLQVQEPVADVINRT